MHARRALLYMPGDDRHKIEKAITLDVDCICMDMEDGVAFSRKTAARRTIAEALLNLDFGRSEKLVRINDIGSGLEQEDIQAVLPFRPDGIVAPKVETLEQLQWVNAKIEAAELANGWLLNSIRILVAVETARAILNLKEIASYPRLDGIIFGGEDYAASVGATRTAEALELLYARSAVVMACAAFGLQAIDMVTVDFRDLERVHNEALFGMQLGSARRMVEAYETSQQEGRGAFALEGRMIDLPLVKAAQNLLARAEAAGNH
jgi:citrate lyase beta subunit